MRSRTRDLLWSASAPNLLILVCLAQTRAPFNRSSKTVERSRRHQVERVVRGSQVDRDLWKVDMASQQWARWSENKFGYGTFGSTRMFEAGYATVESTPINLDLGAFSG